MAKLSGRGYFFPIFGLLTVCLALTGAGAGPMVRLV